MSTNPFDSTSVNLPASFGRRRLLTAALALPALAAVLAACGDDTQGKGANPTVPPTVPPTDATTPPTGATATPPTDSSTPGTATPGTGSGAITHPTGADEVVVRLAYTGGLVPYGVAFQNTPSLLISGDRRVYTPGVTTAIFPGPLVPAINVRAIDEEGIQRVLGLAAEAKLLQTPPDYSADLTIADAPNTQLVLNANGSSYTHEAYALGMQDPAETKDRNVLNGVVIQLADLEKLVGAEHLGDDAPLVPEAYRIQARPLTVEELDAVTDPAPTIVPWPDAAGVTLASAAKCAIVMADAIGTLFSDANQRTFFTEGDGETATAYEVTVAPLLPGDAC